MGIRRFVQKDRVFLRLGLILLMLQEPVGLLAQNTPVQVTLTPTTSPTAGQPGITNLSVTGSNFPSGTISASLVTVTLTPANSGPTLSATVTGITTIVGSTRKVSFQVIGPNVASPTPYNVSVSGTSSGGQSFISANQAALTINPPPAVSLAPSSAGIGSKWPLPSPGNSRTS